MKISTNLDNHQLRYNALTLLIYVNYLRRCYLNDGPSPWQAVRDNRDQDFAGHLARHVLCTRWSRRFRYLLQEGAFEDCFNFLLHHVAVVMSAPVSSSEVSIFIRKSCVCLASGAFPQLYPSNHYSRIASHPLS